MKNTFKYLILGTLTLNTLFSSSTVMADEGKHQMGDSSYSKKLSSSSENPTAPSRKLASTASEESDIEHYKKLQRRLGVDIGLMVPMGDFSGSFGSTSLIGLHFTWEAISPFALRVSTHRASGYHKDGAASGKLTVSQINVGAQASFDHGRYLPFLIFEGSFNFNDVAFGTNNVEAGSDTFVTTVGLNVGGGVDFIVGREMSFGFQATYHYLVPKKVTRTGAAMFNLGSSYATLGFRINF